MSPLCLKTNITAVNDIKYNLTEKRRITRVTCGEGVIMTRVELALGANRRSEPKLAAVQQAGPGVEPVGPVGPAALDIVPCTLYWCR